LRHVRFPVAAVVLCALLAHPAGAQPAPNAAQLGVGIDVSPTKIDLDMPASTLYTMPMTVSNPGGVPMHIVVTPQDFRLSATGEYSFLSPGSLPYSLMKFVRVSPREFDVPPNTTQQIRVTFAMPASASGEYGGVMLFQTKSDRKARMAVQLGARIAAKFYCVIRNSAVKTGKVTSVVTSRQSAGEQYQITFRDSGNTHLYLKGYVEVRHDGQTVERLTMPADMLVERGTDRLITVSGKRLPPGRYQAVAAVDFGGARFSGGVVDFTAQ